MAAVVACGPAPSTTVACEPSVAAAPSMENPTWLGDAAAPSASVSVTTQDAWAGRPLIVCDPPSCGVNAASPAASGMLWPSGAVQTTPTPNGPNVPAVAAVSTCLVTVRSVVP